CTSGSGTSRATLASSASGTTPSPLPTVSLPRASGGPESERAVQARLCRHPPVPKATPASSGPIPPAIRRVEEEVQTVRGLRYLHPVAVDPVTHDELVKGVDQSFEHSYPAG